jgi:uncharacterized protein
MIKMTRALIARRLDALLHVHDTPERTAAAFALGVFFGFSPLLGFHTVLALLMAFLLDFNRVAVLLGTYANLPWIMAPYYTLGTMAGAWVLGTQLPPGFPEQVHQAFDLHLWHGGFWHELVESLRPLLWPYVLGSTVGAVLMAALAYRVVLAFILARRKHGLHGLQR